MELDKYFLEPIKSFLPEDTNENISTESFNNIVNKFTNIRHLLEENIDEEENYNNFEKARFKTNKAKNILKNLENQILISKMSKGGKYKNNYNNNKGLQPPEFAYAGNLKANWIKRKDINLLKLDKEKVKVNLKKINTNDNVSYINEGFVNNKNFNFLEVKNHIKKSESYQPLEDPVLNEKFKTKIEGKSVIVISDNVFYALCVNNYSNFPYNINIKKNGNNFVLYSDSYDKTQFFVNYNTLNENDHNILPTNENDILKLCYDSHLIEQNVMFMANKDNLKEENNLLEYNTELKNKEYEYFEIELDDDIIIYTKIEKSLKDSKGNSILVKTINEHNNPPLWKNSKNSNLSLLFNECYRANQSRICKWIIQSYLLKENELILETKKIRRRKNNEESSENEEEKIKEVKNFINIYFINKSNLMDKNELIYMESNEITDLIKFIGIKFDSVFSYLKANLSILKFTDDEIEGNYILNKGSFNKIISLYRDIN